MSHLESLIRSASENGLRIHLWPCAGGFQANVAEPSVNAWTCYTHPDPIEALSTALRQRGARVPDREITVEPEQMDLEDAIAAASADPFDSVFD